MPTIQERRHQELTAQLKKALEQRDGAITKLVKCEEKLVKLRRHVARYEKYAMSARLPKPQPPAAKQAAADVTDIPVSEFPIADDLEIPGFLQRTKVAGANRDAEIAKTIQAEQDERKALKARARIDKMKAKQRGDLKRMPLTGKAAIEAIRQA